MFVTADENSMLQSQTYDALVGDCGVKFRYLAGRQLRQARVSRCLYLIGLILICYNSNSLDWLNVALTNGKDVITLQSWVSIENRLHAIGDSCLEWRERATQNCDK
jgi:hypothetical protein